jgi:hypothetical protein
MENGNWEPGIENATPNYGCQFSSPRVSYGPKSAPIFQFPFSSFHFLFSRFDFPVSIF